MLVLPEEEDEEDEDDPDFRVVGIDGQDFVVDGDDVTFASVGDGDEVVNVCMVNRSMKVVA